jgi:hypothetical protein
MGAVKTKSKATSKLLGSDFVDPDLAFENLRSLGRKVLTISKAELKKREADWKRDHRTKN